MEKVKVSLTPISTEFPHAEECNDFQVLLRLEAPAEVKQRIPIDLVTVLDVGGSMGREAAPQLKKTSRLDLLKRAMKFVITQLHNDDRLAIVAFNNKVVAEYTTAMFQISGRRMYAENMVGELAAKGETVFQPGLEHAVKILDDRPEKANRPGFILLLTDGVDSSKVKWDAEHMLQVRRDILSKYPVHTFGFCAAHDPQTLLLIAQGSHGGTYSFLDDDNLDKITDAFAVCLGGFSNIFAFDVDLNFSSNRENANLTSIDSGVYESEMTKLFRGHTAGSIKVGTLYAGEVMNFIIHIHLFRGYGRYNDNSYTNVCQVRGEYKVTPDGPFVAADCPLDQLPVKRSRDVVEGTRQLQVMEQILRFKVLEMVAGLQHTLFKDLRNIAGIEKDNADDIKKSMLAQDSAANTLLSKWEGLKQEWTLDVWHGLEVEIREMVTRLREGKGVAYICSWLSSYGMQRATSMGPSNEVAACVSLTPVVKAMLKESEYFQSALELERSIEEESPTTDYKPKPPPAPPIPQPAAACNAAGGTVPFAFEPGSWMEQRLEAWSKVQRELLLMPHAMEDPQLAGVREAITRAMHYDVYLAVVHGGSNNVRSGADEDQKPAMPPTKDEVDDNDKYDQ